MGPSNVYQLGSKEGISVPNLALIVPLSAVVVAETALFFDRLDYALWVHFATLLGCLVAPRFVADDFFPVIALLPLFRLVNLGMPVFFELTLLWFPLIYAPVVPAVYLVARSREDISLRFNPRAFLMLLPIAVVVSAIMGVIEYSIIETGSLIPSWTLANVLLLAGVMVLFVGFVEEALFRGVLQTAFESRLGVVPGIVIASVLFGLLHSGYHTPMEIVFASSVGLIFGVVYYYTDSLGLITVMHGVLNIVLFGVVPLFPQYGL